MKVGKRVRTPSIYSRPEVSVVDMPVTRAYVNNVGRGGQGPFRRLLCLLKMVKGLT